MSFTILTLARGYEGVNYDLGTIGKVAELSLPDNQILWIIDGHAVLKSQHRLLRQYTMG